MIFLFLLTRVGLPLSAIRYQVSCFTVHVVIELQLHLQCGGDASQRHLIGPET